MRKTAVSLSKKDRFLTSIYTIVEKKNCRANFATKSNIK